MNILLLSATSLEIQPAIDNDIAADTLIAGVGIPATIYRLTKQLNNSHYDLVVQAGIGGSFSEDLFLGETVLIKQDTFADIGVEEKENLKNIFDMGLADKDQFPFSDGWLINDNAILHNSSLKKVKGITVNKISDNKKQNDLFFERYTAQIESMEGAALHYVCLQQQIPFIQVRSISNYIGERDKSKWKMKNAIANLNEELQKLINH